jgi:hypothetical protein
MTSAPWRLLLPVLVAVGLLAGPSSWATRPTAVDVQAARACWAFGGFYNGPPPPYNPLMFSRQPLGERAMLTKDYKKMLATVPTPSAQDVRDAVSPLSGTKWAVLGTHLLAAADAGQTGRGPQDQTLLAPIDPECNQLSIAAKLAGGWKPGF